MSKLLFALRHGERADRAFTNRSCPIKFDPCLTEKGLIQAEQSAKKIADMIPLNSSIHLVSSPFLRCIETASKLAELLKVPIHIDEGFAEFLFSHDFDFNPLNRLNFNLKGLGAIQNELKVELIENNHMPGPIYPETYRIGHKRITENWETYFPQRNEDVIIVVSHLFVVGTLSEIWLGSEY